MDEHETIVILRFVIRRISKRRLYSLLRSLCATLAIFVLSNTISLLPDAVKSDPLSRILKIQEAQAAITYDTSNTGTVDTNSTSWSLTFSATVSAGNNKVLIVGVSSEGTNSSSETMTHTGVTFGGVALTQVGSTYQYNTSIPNDYLSYWYLLNPTSQTANIVVTGTKSASTTAYIRAGTTVLQGVKQQAPEAYDTAKGNGTALSVSITTLTDSAWIVDIASGAQGNNNLAPQADQTEHWETTSNIRANGSTKSLASHAATTMSWTAATSEDWGMFAAAFAPYKAPVISVWVSDSTFTFGTNPLDTWMTPQTSVITNDGTVAENFAGRITQFTDGANTWGISPSANGNNIIRAQWSTTSQTGPWTDISAYDTDFTIATNVAVNGTINFWFRIQTPTSTSSYNQYSSTLTVTAQKY
jgi:hypothetical protein